MVAPYPKAEDYVFDAAAEKDILWIKDFVTAVRNLRAEMKAGPGVKLAPIVRGASEDEQRCAKDNSRCLTLVANIEPIVFADSDANIAALCIQTLRYCRSSYSDERSCK